MTSMEIFITVILGIVMVAAVVIFAIRRGRSATVDLSVKDIVNLTVAIGADDKANVTTELERAAELRGDAAPRSEMTELPDRVRVERILWLDDHPDYNVHETIALHRIGLPVTHAVSGEAALEYLSAEPYAAVITDIGRDDDPMQVAEFTARARALRAGLSIVAYTSPRAASRIDPSALGLDHITADPTDLIQAVVRRLDAAPAQARGRVTPPGVDQTH